MELKITDLELKIKGRDILRGVSLSFTDGLNYIAGLNGSGKTSLLHCISGRYEYKGAIRLDGADLDSLTPRERARRISLVPQRLQTAFRVDVFDFVLMGRYPYLDWMGSYTAADREAARGSLEKMGVAALSGRRLDEVSGGELQKVLIARALCQDAPFLLLDEPAQGLDPRNRAEAYALLRELSQSGKTVLCTTHDADAIRDGEARVLGLREGKLVWDSPGGEDLPAQMAGPVYGME